MGGLKGVIRTRVGYAGGESENPTYHNLGGHTETVQVDFDPRQISYESLVEFFFQAHDSTIPGLPRQYRSVIFTQGAEQANVAQTVMQRVQATVQRPVQTVVIPLQAFHLAEDYHQKYALQQDGIILPEFKAMYPDIWAMVDSTAATRVNAYLYGEGGGELFATEVDLLGLSDKAVAHLRDATPAGACSLQ